MQRVNREQARKYAFDWRDEPLLRVQPGEAFELETYDPSAGPIFVEGARRGDALVVVLEQIAVDDYSWIAIGPRRGPLGESTRWPELSSDYTTRIFRHTAGPSGTTRDG